MGTRSKCELAILTVVGVAFLMSLYPSLRWARRNERDNQRQSELARYKIEIEQYNNKHKTYPLQFSVGVNEYVVVSRDAKGATGWHLRTRLENERPSGSYFDAEEGRNYFYRIERDRGATYYKVCGGEYSCE